MKPTQHIEEPIEMNFELKNEAMMEALFVLDQGWNIMIEQCSKVGASILLPNFQMGPALLMSSILRQGKTTILTSEKIWSLIKDTFLANPVAQQKIQVVLFNPEEEYLFGLN